MTTSMQAPARRLRKRRFQNLRKRLRVRRRRAPRREAELKPLKPGPAVEGLSEFSERLLHEMRDFDQAFMDQILHALPGSIVGLCTASRTTPTGAFGHISQLPQVPRLPDSYRDSARYLIVPPKRNPILAVSGA